MVSPSAARRIRKGITGARHAIAYAEMFPDMPLIMLGYPWPNDGSLEERAWFRTVFAWRRRRVRSE